jgi:hypothetical protein
LQEAIRSYFEFVSQMLVEQHNVVTNQVSALLETNPMSLMVEIAQRNLALWTSMQEATSTGRAGPDSSAPRTG